MEKNDSSKLSELSRFLQDFPKISTKFLTLRFFNQNDFTLNKSIYQGNIWYVLGPLYTNSGVVGGGSFFYVLDKRYRIIVVWDINLKKG